jgi:hypothetical protein
VVVALVVVELVDVVTELDDAGAAAAAVTVTVAVGVGAAVVVGAGVAEVVGVMDAAAAC